ncbi:hypothetical protein FLA_3068 [Filimonas lacunae]|nr:hypothetical protein FLA_3068 [Filimonas lacunae]
MHAQDKNKKDAPDSTPASTLKSYQTLFKKAITSKGLITVHQVGMDYYFEIPLVLLEKDFLLVNKVSSVPLAINEAGVNKGMNTNNKVIRFSQNKQAGTVWVKTIVPQVEVPAGDAIAQSVQDNFTGSVIENFKIETYSPDSSALVIKVNKVFDGTEKSFNDVFTDIGLGTSARTALSGIEHIKSFPQNVVVRSLLSTSVTEGETTIAVSVAVTTNLLLLPEKPMQPRFSDKRIGYFSTPRWYFSDTQQKMETRELITRWRMEPRAADRARYLRGELVEPEKPIIYYIDPATPKQWRTYIIAGIHDWQKAFEAAGFKNAIQAREVTDTADFDGDDVRYSVVTYAASPKSNAMGPAVVDPRSGEILESDVIWWHNVMTSLQYWMRIQTGIIDSAARTNQFSVEQMGNAIRFVSSHEIGHTLGLKHNMGASAAYPVDSLRSATYTAKMGGTAPSIMDYARFNYVAQPEDHVTAITPSMGVYDTYAIAWGYRWLGDTINAWQELNSQQQYINDHANNPLYHYGEQQSSLNIIDPRAQSEDLGDNAMKAGEYGLKNLERLVPQIQAWTTSQGENYYQAGKLYMAAIWQWNTYTEHVMANIGGYYLETPVLGDRKKAYTPVAKTLQQQAMAWLQKHLLALPAWLFMPDLLSSTFAVKDSPLGPFECGPYDMKREQQYGLLYSLFSDERLLRMLEMENIYGKSKVFAVADLFKTTRSSIFAATLKNAPLSLDQRLTQQNYVDVLLVSTDKLMEKITKKTLTPPALTQHLPQLCDLTPRALQNHAAAENAYNLRNIYVTAMARTSGVAAAKRGELLNILQLLEKHKVNTDEDTRNHYLDLILRIKQNLKLN